MMFTDFANVWTPVIRSNRLQAQAPLGLEVAGEQVVFFRDATGKAAALTAAGLQRTWLDVEWNAHWTRARENMLDSPHVPFVHRRTIGRLMRRHLRQDSRMDIDWQDTAYGGRTHARLDGQPPASCPPIEPETPGSTMYRHRS